jgi:hypothetical protein
MNLGKLEYYRLECIYIIESILDSNEVKITRGTCFSISQNLLLTAHHVVSGFKELKVYLSSDDFDAGLYLNAEYIHGNEGLDVAILKLESGLPLASIDLCSARVSLDCEVMSCGYPIEKEHYHALIKEKVTNTFNHMASREYSFEVSQSSIVTAYKGMSGSPVMYNGQCIGILLVQQGANTLYSISMQDILKDLSLRKLIFDANVNINDQEDFASKATAHPLLPNSTLFTSPEIWGSSEEIDRLIESKLDNIKLSRFFFGYPTIDKTRELYEKLIDGGSLSRGNNKVKCIALAWCARLLTVDESCVEIAKNCLCIAKKLASDQEETLIAEAFITAKFEGEDDAIVMLMAKPTPMRISLAFMILSITSPLEAVTWKEASDISLSELDPDGKVSYLNALFSCENWDKAAEEALSINQAELEKAPALYSLVAMANLIITVPTEYRALVMTQIPIMSKEFPLKSDSVSMERRRKAQLLFDKSSIVASDLGCIEVSEMLADYALWLRLKDFQTREAGLIELRANLKSSKEKPELALRRFPLARDFGIQLEYLEIEKAIDKLSAKTRGKSSIAAIARFCIIPINKSPKDALEYLIKFRDSIQPYIATFAFLNLEVQLLAKVGRVKEATTLVDQFSRGSGKAREVEQLQDLIALEQGVDELQLAIERFNDNNSYDELNRIVLILLDQKDYPRADEYAAKLFKIIKNVTNATYVLEAKAGLRNYKEIGIFLRENSELIEQSTIIQTHWAWLLYQEGKLQESKHQLSIIKEKVQNSNIRALEVNLSITSGDWDSLCSFIEGEWRERSLRSASELLFAGKLAQTILPKRSKQLIIEATKKEKDNPEVLTAAYSIAGNLGTEGNQDVALWINRAVQLSGDDGPIRSFSMKELMDFINDSQKRNDNIWEIYINGKAPICIVGHYLNRTLADFYLSPWISNKNEPDLRKNILIPAFSNLRFPYYVEINHIALDVTTILTLANLGMLKIVLDGIEKITIPHSTLHWLFDEKQKCAFHQPSRIEEARKIMQLMGSCFNELKSSLPSDADLTIEVGEELSNLLTEANAISASDTRQRLVVRVCPVHKSGTFMETTVDLEDYSHCLVSCLSVLDKLSVMGVITNEHLDEALTYLQLHDKKWPNEVLISSDAILLLDGLSVTYLQYVDVLEKLSSAGFTCLVHEYDIKQYRELLAHELITKKISTVIDEVQSTFFEYIESGKVTIAHVSTRKLPEFPGNYPSMELIDLEGELEVIVSDDRFLNRHKNIALKTSDKPILTTLDLLDILCKKNIISKVDVYSARTKLRQCGYIFIPIVSEELNVHFNKATIVDRVLQETAELKAIRENLLLIKLSRFIQLPRDVEWLLGGVRELTNNLRSQWTKGLDVNICIARSEWLLKSIDYRGWSQCYDDDKIATDFVKDGASVLINSLLLAPSEIGKDMNECYWDWLENNVIEPLKISDPETFRRVVSFSKAGISRSVQGLLTNEDHE